MPSLSEGFTMASSVSTETMGKDKRIFLRL
jgi:hypothetical protein